MDELRFPGESAEYRAARDALLTAEHELTRQVEAVAEQRRALPLGGAVPQDYEFTEGPADPAADEPVHRVRLSEVFGEHDTLVLYSFMFGPDMGQPCQMCTSLLDGLDGAAPDIAQRVAFAVVAGSPIGRIRAYARQRHWTNLRLLSSEGTTYNRDYHGEDADGAQLSRVNVFVRRDGAVHHFYATEKESSGDGQDSRHVDLIWPLWQMFDLVPAGRGDDWLPSYTPRR